MTTLTQEAQILNILLEKGEIDNFFCLDKRISIRLGAYIYNLRNKGYVIETHHNKKTRNTTYILKEKPKTLKKAV
ncbi:helix-turn-helix domain-containing protein [Campylobacter molothri]|uniref:Uncharacterized protein n=1 Tax=Campylobacter molothri TaxID=1032242 RepID=A0ACC5W243_9BACT|nr:hypothetical protein [Campylobacter sp. RM9754]